MDDEGGVVKLTKFYFIFYRLYPQKAKSFLGLGLLDG
jgi:hypothetical protein